ncbi:MAG: methyltransferase [Firmicutes bacterium]|nr:methyltransferase [Bacillota bacterium]
MESVFSLPGREIRLHLVKDVEALITDPEDEDKVPCWAEVWPAARGLASYIWENLSFGGERVIELGAGIGLPGVVCGLKGARVTFSDFNPLALEVAAKNAASNGLADYSLLLGDWRCFPRSHSFDYVVGSDIFYDPKLNVHLARVIDSCLPAGGRVLLAHPGREASFNFIRGLLSAGYGLEKEALHPVVIDDPYFPYYEIRINVLTKKSGRCIPAGP